MTAKITFVRTVESPELQTCTVTVNEVQVSELMLDPTAEMPEWYSNASAVRLNCGRMVEVDDCEYGRSLRETKRYLVNFIRGQLSAQ